ncbi:MAG: hypothetical protein V3V99_08465 [candidate division Zixibacteria bacterium]
MMNLGPNEIERRKRKNIILVPIVLGLFGILILLMVFFPNEKNVLRDKANYSLADNRLIDSIITPQYSILKKELGDVVGGIRLHLDILVFGNISEEGLKKLLTEIERDIMTQYYTQSNGHNIYYSIIAYISKEHFDGGSAIASLIYNIERDIWVNYEQLNYLNSRDEIKYGISEETRLKIYWDNIKAQRQAFEEKGENVSEYDRQVIKYKQDICNKYGITEDQLMEISIEAMLEDWPLPPILGI